MASQYLITSKELKKHAKAHSGGSGIDISMKDAFPDYFQSTNKPPKLIVNIATKVMDAHFKEEEGRYCLENPPLINIYYNKIPATAAKAKAQIITDKLQAALKAALAGDDNPGSQVVDDGPKKVGHADEGMSKIIREGLHENPSADELKFWAERVSQDIYSTPPNKPMPHSIFAIGQALQRYLPIWSPQNEKIIGSMASLAGLGRPLSLSEQLRRDFVNLVACYIQGLLFARAQGNGFISLPLDIRLLQDSKLAELYLLIIKRIHPTVRDMILLEIVGIKKDKPSESVCTHIRSICQSIKFVFIESSLLSPTPHDIPGCIPLAYGFKMGGMSLGTEEVRGMVEKFVQKFNAQKMKIYAKNVTTLDDLNMLMESGVTYISGPAVCPAQKKCFNTAPYGYEQIAPDD